MTIIKIFIQLIGGGIIRSGVMKKIAKLRYFSCVTILTYWLLSLPANSIDLNVSNFSSAGFSLQKNDRVVIIEKTDLNKLNKDLVNLLQQFTNDTRNKMLLEKSRILIEEIFLIIENDDIDSLDKSDSYYLAGIYYLMTAKFQAALNNLKKSLVIREMLSLNDIRYAKILYNIGASYRGMGDFDLMEKYELKSLKVYKQIYGESSYELIDVYSSLISAYIELHEYDKALAFSNIAFSIGERNRDSISPQSLAFVYSNLGVCYNRLEDFSKSKIYLEKAESLYEKNPLEDEENLINLINNLAISYDGLGLKERSIEYYLRGVNKAMGMKENPSYSFNIVNSYAITLGNNNEKEKGEKMLNNVLAKAYTDIKNNEQLYFEVLCNYAEYLYEYDIDYQKSIEYYSKCLDYLRNNPNDNLLNNRVKIGYALSLNKAGEPLEALEIIQLLVNENYGLKSTDSKYENPDIKSIKADKMSLRIFNTKSKILNDVYIKTNDFKILEAGAITSELTISIIEKIRINISEEESKLLLGDKYRDSYFQCIHNFDLLYRLTSDEQYLSKSFEYMEKSKVAGLLSSTRELKATEFQIPDDVATLEFILKRDIAALNVLISDEAKKNIVNSDLVGSLNEKLLRTTRSRDSLIRVFENRYPGYYAVKYNTKVASLTEIPGIIGRNNNYVNYLLSDTVIYIFIANRKYSQLKTIQADTALLGKLRQFRKLLSIPESSADAQSDYLKFQIIGSGLYKKLIVPILPYLISDRILISPDNLLSYIPLETLPVGAISEVKPYYNSIHYLMEDYDISYTYSATFMNESSDKSFGFSNRLVAFAPNYPSPIDVNSVLMNRQEKKGILSELPFARQEAEFVTQLTNGTLFENSQALESVFKREAGKYDIIHLAMHTIMNDKEPMRSTLIFSNESDSVNDRYLKTYEIYAIPLKARMVVLSSCNTGSGYLSSGEGILSLARGFIYSGSQSVVMSMWEIEDRSGTDIVKLFYKNLLKGYSKSSALRKARLTFLKNSDQLRSHPYFWSALIVYGNNSPLFLSRYLIIFLTVFCLIIISFVVIYFRKRKYS